MYQRGDTIYLGGWDDYNNRSNAASQAVDNGLIPMTGITNELLSKYGIPFKYREFRKLILERQIEPDEWHHMGSSKKEILFIDLDSLRRWLYDEDDKIEDYSQTVIQQRINEICGVTQPWFLAEQIAPTLIESINYLALPPSPITHKDREKANLEKYGMSRNQWEKLQRKLKRS